MKRREPQKRAAVSLLGGSSPTPGLPGCPQCLTREKAQPTCAAVCPEPRMEKALIHRWHKHCFSGHLQETRHLISKRRTCRGEASCGEAEKCVEIFTSWLFPAAALAIPVADLMLINIPGRQKQHVLAQPGPWVSWQCASEGS